MEPIVYYKQMRKIAMKKLTAAKREAKIFMENQPRFATAYDPSVEVRSLEAEIAKWDARIEKVS
jgi:hypothetical protein